MLNNHMNNSATPPIVIAAPNTSFADTFSLNTIIEIGIINIREMEEICEVRQQRFRKHIIEDKDTPINGPKNDPIEIYFIALKSLTAIAILLQFFLMVIIIAKATVAAIIRI